MKKIRTPDEIQLEITRLEWKLRELREELHISDAVNNPNYQEYKGKWVFHDAYESGWSCVYVLGVTINDDDVYFYGFEQDKLGYLNIRSLQAEAEIETDFEKLYFISSEFDDPLSLDNCATASALVKNGGFYLKNKSNGERQLQSLSKWIHENKADWNEKCLLVFDEVDKGFDLRYQVGLHNMLTNLPVMHGVKILAVSHTLIPMLLEDKVYAFKYRIMLSPSTYVALETGYSIKINDYNEREEV